MCWALFRQLPTLGLGLSLSPPLVRFIVEQVQTRCHLNTPRVIGSSGGDQQALHCLSPFYFVSKSHGLDIFTFLQSRNILCLFSHFLSAGLLGTYTVKAKSLDAKIWINSYCCTKKILFFFTQNLFNSVFCFSWQTLLPLIVH